jgi:preprotein translocase subunit YajC
MFISPAYAQGLGGSAEMLQSMLPIVLIIVVMYFLLMRPQQQKAKQLKEMLASLRRGDRVVTGGGIIGTVVKVVNDEEVTVEIAEGMRVRVVRATISTVLSKPEPVAAKGKDKDKEKDDEESDSSGDDANKAKGGRRAAGGN